VARPYRALVLKFLADGLGECMSHAGRKVEMGLTDAARRVRQEVGGSELIAPCSVGDIRRWVMAQDYPKPMRGDRDFAAASSFDGIIAPQSIAVDLDYGQVFRLDVKNDKPRWRYACHRQSRRPPSTLNN
jgi:N-terminal half of MaoC dehydratase